MSMCPGGVPSPSRGPQGTVEGVMSERDAFAELGRTMTGVSVAAAAAGGLQLAVRAAIEADERLLREMAAAASSVVETWEAFPMGLRNELLALAPLEDDDLEDWEPYDLDPDGCWRCEAVDAENDLGTCVACLADLRSTQ